MNLKTNISKRTIIIAVGIILLAFLAVAALLNRSSNGISYRTVPVKRGDLLATISATGTVEPEEVIDIGAQVAGKIIEFGKDKHGKPVDYGSVVEAGMVLARIDDALYAADAAAAQAQMEQSKAALKRAEADLGQLKAKLYQAQRDWARAQKLGPSDALSQADYDAAQSAYDTAKANLEVGKAAIVQAQKVVKQSEAALKRARQNLSYCTIVSPVKGVIIDRRVNIGQTVVASLNAPSLFLLAKDLNHLQVWVSVNEADIGHIHPGQPVSFTVDAHPGEEFPGEVGKIRLNANMTQNVVTYTVEVNTDNSGGKLLPYLTANVSFIVGEQRNVLLVPNSALRWVPQPDQVVPGYNIGTKGDKGARATAQGKPAAEKQEQARGIVWVPQASQVRPVKVKLGLSDGSQTEVVSSNLKEGELIIVGEAEQKAAKAAPGGSPFTPQLFRKSANDKASGK